MMIVKKALKIYFINNFIIKLLGNNGLKPLVLRVFILMTSIFFTTNIHAKDDLPSIILPKVDIEIEDIKKIDINSKLEDIKLPDIKVDSIPIPDFSSTIKIDLEHTLPEKIDSPSKGKPVDAIILFGYGLNNFLFADFSIFVKDYNPKVSIRYIRESKENLWFDKPYIKNPVSTDDLKAELIYNYKIFNLGAEVGYYSKSYKLQDNSVFDSLTKRVLNVDLGPSLKFNNQNDLTVRVLNSFLFNNCDGKITNSQINRNDFDYILNTDIVYTQVFGNNHFFTSHIGYDFNYLDSKVKGDNLQLNTENSNYFFNNIKAGLSYSTTFLDAILLKASVDFLGTFRSTEFFWYILPIVKFGYSFQEFFSCYIEGGGELLEKPNLFWFKENDFVFYPASITPGYHWYAKSGIKGTFTGWFSGNIDLEFAYNQDGFDWDLSSASEKLYTLKKASFMELNLNTGIAFNYREFVELKVDYVHNFLSIMHFDPQDKITATTKFVIPKSGLSLFINFEADFVRFDLNDLTMGNIYLMNAGIDWAWQERIGFGAKFNNILYFQTYELMPGYNEPGFEFLAYIRVGF